MIPGVQQTRELLRIIGLPRRTWSDDAAAQLAARLTAALSRTTPGHDGPDAPGQCCTRCGSPLRLRPVQAIALAEIGAYGGMWGPIRVGGGKTMISLLAPEVLGSRRPLILVPANLIEKTEATKAQLAPHWRVPERMWLISYELLGRRQSGEKRDPKGNVIGPALLDRLEPDAIIADESQRLKDPHCAVTKRVLRYLKGKQ